MDERYGWSAPPMASRKRQLAARIDVSPSHLSLVENGKRDPSLKLLQQIAVSLAVPMHLLTLLASDVGNVDDPDHADHIAQVAKALLRVLVAEGQPMLPLKKPRKEPSQ